MKSILLLLVSIYKCGCLPTGSSAIAAASTAVDIYDQITDDETLFPGLNDVNQEYTKASRDTLDDIQNYIFVVPTSKKLATQPSNTARASNGFSTSWTPRLIAFVYEQLAARVSLEGSSRIEILRATIKALEKIKKINLKPNHKHLIDSNYVDLNDLLQIIHDAGDFIDASEGKMITWAEYVLRNHFHKF